MAETDFKAKMEEISPAKKGEPAKDTVRVLLGKGEIESIIEGKPSTELAGNVLELIGAVKQPVYESKKDDKGKERLVPVEGKHTDGIDGVKDLLVGFGNDGKGTRGLHLDRERVLASGKDDVVGKVLDEAKTRSDALAETKRARQAEGQAAAKTAKTAKSSKGAGVG